MRVFTILLLLALTGCPTTQTREPYYPPESRREHEAQLNEACHAWEQYKQEQYGIHESLPK